jgi:hypothetical protein
VNALTPYKWFCHAQNFQQCHLHATLLPRESIRQALTSPLKRKKPILNDKRKVTVTLSSHDFFINNSKILIRNLVLPKNVVNVFSRSMHQLLCYRTGMVFKNKIEFFQIGNAPFISLQAHKTIHATVPDLLFTAQNSH